MRKLILMGLVAAIAVPSAVSAQSREEVRRYRAEVQDRRDDVRDARQRGDRRDVREAREDLRDARGELRDDRRDHRRAQYVAPYSNWRYSAVRPGSQLRAGFYGQRYYISDPRQYRLQPAARNQRWIRYGDDLVLVNTRNGRVIQVIRNRY